MNFIFKNLSDLDDQIKYDHHICIVDILVALCQKKEALCWWKTDCAWSIEYEKKVFKSSSFFMICTRTQCFFCFRNLSESYEVWLHNFVIVYKARNHVKLHLKHYKLNDNILCSDSEFQKTVIVLHDHSHFMSHTACEHRYDIFCKSS